MKVISRRGLLVGAGAIAAYGYLSAAPRASARSVAITHGAEIDATRVGPPARGYRSLMRYAGGVIRDGFDYPFARPVSSSATYHGFEARGPHLLIEGAAFTGSLDIYATRPVVFLGCSIRIEKSSYWALLARPGAGPVFFLWSEAGSTSAGGDPNDTSHAVPVALQLRADDAIVYRSRVSMATDGIHPNGNRISIIENLIDGLTYYSGDHNDGIQIETRAHDIAIVRNKILNPHRQTSCLNLLGNRIRVEANYLAGGGYVIYGGARSNGHGGPRSSAVKVTDNILGREYFPKGGHFGPVAYWQPSEGNVWRNNRFDDGMPVDVE